MAESPKSEASHDESVQAGGKAHAAKDKQCHYCHQHFTSSSLGRHLDQFIFRKKPDGIHNVEEIRRLRGGITRRTAKGSTSAKREGDGSSSTPHSTTRTSPVNRESPARGESHSDLNATAAEGFRIRLNQPNWQSTGVINGLPNSTTASPVREINSVSKNEKSSYSSFETAAAATAKETVALRGDVGPEKDTARALELALREVLDTIQAARIKAKPQPSPYPIDIEAHNFPALVLRLLPQPPSLLTSSTPFAIPTSFPLISPPCEDHYRVLHSTLISLTRSWLAHLAPRDYSDAQNSCKPPTLSDRYLSPALSHLDLAYSHYTSLSPQQRSEIWNIELARAFVSEQQQRKQIEDRLESVLAEARQLNEQVEYLSRCQWPREMALWPPERRPIRRHVIREMERMGGGGGKKRRRIFDPDTGAGTMSTGYEASAYPPSENESDSAGEEESWDYDTLLNKWKRIVREDAVRNNKHGLARRPSYATSPVLADSGGTVNDHTASMGTRRSKVDGDDGSGGGDDLRAPAFEPWSKRPTLVFEHQRNMADGRGDAGAAGAAGAGDEASGEGMQG